MHALLWLCLGCGAILVTCLPVLPGPAWLLPAAALLVPCAGWRPLRRALPWLLAVLAGLLLGVLAARHTLERLWPVALEDQPVAWAGCVTDYASVRRYGTGSRAPEEWRFPALGLDDGRLLRVSVTGIAPPQPGSCYRFEARIRRPRGLSSPGAQAWDGWLLGQGLHGLARARHLEPLPQQLPAWQRHTTQWRQHWVDAIHGLGLSPLSTRLLLGMVAGQGSALQVEDWRLLQETGTTHLFVVSGLHIGFAGLLGYGLGWCLAVAGRLAGLRLPAWRVGLLAGCLAAWAFCLLSGSGVAACRAAFMLTVLSAGLLAGRVRTAALALAMGFAVLTALNPWVVYQAGFWLSFAAVACLWLAFAPYRERPGWWRVLWRSQWAIGLGLLPVLLVLGKPLSSGGWLVNLLAVPFSNACVTLVLLLLPWSGWLPVPGWLAGALDAFVRLGWAGLQLARDSGFSSTVWLPPPPSAGAFVLAVVAVLLLLLPVGWRLRCLCPLLLLPWAWPWPTAPAHGGLAIDVLDVGQGQAVLLRTQQHALLYDAGPAYPEGWSAAETILWPLLAQQGVRRLDRIVISHGDNDHAGGFGWLQARFPQAEVLQVGLEGVGRPCRRGERWRWDGVVFELLHPGPEAGDGNNASCVLRVALPGFVALLPGDIERASEYRLLQEQPAALRADWLLAPHHGSRSSSSWPWAKAVQPQRVVFSAGYRSRFGHPAADVVARWQALGAVTRETARCGSYALRVDAAGRWQERCHRESGRPFWRDP